MSQRLFRPSIQVALSQAFLGWMFALTLLPSNAMASEPQLQRIEMTTVMTSDLDTFERNYTRWLGYTVRERATISRSLAASWGAPAVAGREYILLSPDSAPDVFVRAVTAPPVPGYRAMTTWGWNAIEIIVDDPVSLREVFSDSPFKIIGEPKALDGYPTIVAFQVLGPDNEVLYLTAETGDRDVSTLPKPGAAIGRVFIMVVAGPEIDALLAWYGEHFNMPYGPAFQTTIGVVTDAQGLSADETVALGLIRLVEHGNLIEFDGYSPAHSGPRPFLADDLPPGIAITTFSVADLDALSLPSITPATAHDGIAYGGKRSITVRGPVGELVEIIER